MLRLCFIILVFTLTACAPKTIKKNTTETPDNSSTKAQLKPIFIKEILDTMESSKILYSANPNPTSNTDINKFDLNSKKAHPLWYVETKESGERLLKVYENNKCSQKKDETIYRLMDQGKYDSSLVEYQKSFECDQDNKKLLTFIGNMFFYTMKFDSAKVYLEKSLSYNPYDYQAHFFLSHTYLKLNNIRLAKSHLIKALALNGRNMNLLNYANTMLDYINQKIDFERLNFGYEIVKTDSSIDIQYSNKDHVVMGMAHAGLKYDPAFKEFRENQDLTKLPYYKSIIFSQYIISSGKLEEKEPIDPTSQNLINIINDELLNSMIYWEITAYDYPAVIYLISPEELASIENYIDKYVIVDK